MAAGPSTYALQVAGGLVRQLWPDESLIEEIIEEEPLLGMCAKETDWGYSVKHFPLGWGANQGIGRVYGDAKRLKSQAKQAEFQIGTREMFASLSLEGKLLRTFEYTKKKALLVDPVQREGEATIDRMRRKFSKAIHGNGVGVIGRIATTSTVNTDTITLDSYTDLKNFEEDTAVWTEHTGQTGGTPYDGEARIIKFGTDDNPTLTIANGQAWNNAFPGLQAGDYLYYPGTYDNDFIVGLDGFLPLHTGNAGANPIGNYGAFYTCDRTKNPQWLGGRCMDGTKLTVNQRIKRAARVLFDGGIKADTYLMSTRNFERWEQEMENKLNMQKFPAADVGKYKLGVSYSGAVVQGPRGPIKVLPSPWMSDNIERCGQMDTFVMGSIGPLVHWDMGNGPDKLRTEDQTDSRELRAVSDPAFVCKKPGAWLRVAA